VSFKCILIVRMYSYHIHSAYERNFIRYLAVVLLNNHKHSPFRWPRTRSCRMLFNAVVFCDLIEYVRESDLWNSFVCFRFLSGRQDATRTYFLGLL